MHDIIIAPDGTATFIHSDEMQGIIEQGEATITRASHVEPDAGGKWVADMAPSGGPVLGPFRTRREALDHEVEWLVANRGL